LAGETLHFEAGQTMATVEVEGLRITPLICYDLRFPELFRSRARATDLFVVIANWPTKRGHIWKQLLPARATDSQAWVLGVNRVGSAQGYEHAGDTTLVAPDSSVVASLSDQEGVVLGEVDADRVRDQRERYGFLDDRRPEVYRALEYPQAAKRSQ
jgi:predicted amidohydrolase